jgi:predicted Zn-dependent protease/tetratricopeptide (TPR) repeat protein
VRPLCILQLRSPPYRAAAVTVSRALVVVAALVLQGTGALADAWEDCIGAALDKVVAGCSAVIEANAHSAPDLARAHVRRGWQYRDQGRLDDALADFQIATQVAPRSADAFEALGAAFRQKGDLVRAAASFEHALQIDPDNARAYVGRGGVHVMRHELDPALADFERAIALHPEYAFAYLSRGLALRQTGNLDRALADFDHAIAIDPGMADAFAARGDAFRFKGELDKAILDFSRAIAIKPKVSTYFSNRGDAFSAKGDVDRAIADYDQVLVLTPGDRHALDMKASALAYKAELARATTGAAPATAPASSALRPSANSASPMQSLAASAMHAQQRNLSQSELDAMREKIRAHWNPEKSFFSQPDQYVIVRVHLDRDGRLSAAPEVVSIHPVLQWWGSAPPKAAAEAAKRAIELSQPFDMLSPSTYDTWKDVEIAFYPGELKAAPVIGNGTITRQRMLSEYGGAYDDHRLQAKLATILSRLSVASGRPDIHYRITILNSPIVDSYVLPSGQLYVTRGLLALANDSAEVAFVMAQQMARVIARHAAILEEEARRTGPIADDAPGDRQAAAMTFARFSLAQKIAADGMGVDLAAKAGFDPFGAARQLNAMARSAELRSAGHNARPPDLTSSYAATLERVRNAQAAAEHVAAIGAMSRDKADYLASIDGMTYGSDADAGFVRGRQFIHPRLGFTFMAPEGFVLDTTVRAMLGSKESDGEALRLDAVKIPAGQSLVEYLNAGWINNIEDGSAEEFLVNGIPAATATAAGDPWSFRLYVVKLDNLAYRIIFAAKKRTAEVDRSFRESIQTFRRLSEREKALGPLHLKVVKVQPGDTVESLAAATAFTDHQVEQFRVLNGLEPNAALKPGDLVKIVVE